MFMKRKQEPMMMPIQPGSLLSLDELRGPDRYRTDCVCQSARQLAHLGRHAVLSRVLA
ncbi:hypothetical protein ACWIEX_02610 [Bosea sp. NPDC055353]